MIFAVKMNFIQKARFVAGGYKTETPALATYSSIIFRDSILYYCLAPYQLHLQIFKNGIFEDN